ncbi:MAG: bifunctional oligoribonuclease/PAP phosphatase NrnA [Anaerolineales bacterium]
MTLTQNELVSVQQMIQAANTIAVVSHERPDGDAIGSLLAVVIAFQQADKQVTAHLLDGLPGRYSFLPGADSVHAKLPENADLWIFVDASDVDRSGFPSEQIPETVDIQIDHHPTNTRFAKFNVVDDKAASTTQILYDLLSTLGFELTPAVATNLLVGLVTDTIGFRTHNVTPEVLEIAANLMRHGASMAEIYEKVLSERSFVSVHYWGKGLNRLERSNGLVWASLTLKDRSEVGYPGSDDADLVNILSSIEGAHIALVFVEQSQTSVKVSWRSSPEYDVSKTAFSFGGGGHKQAAGATIEGTLAEVQAQVLAATEMLLAPQEA